MPVIYKYPLQLSGLQKISMPIGAKPLSVQIQDGQLCLWAQVDPAAPIRDYVVKVFGTGSELSNPGEYIGTVQDHNYVWHIFMER